MRDRMNAGLLIVSSNSRSQVCISGRFHESGHTVLIVVFVPYYTIIYEIIELAHVAVGIVLIRIYL